MVLGTTCVGVHIWRGIGGPGLDVNSDLKQFLPSTAYILISYSPTPTPNFQNAPFVYLSSNLKSLF